MGEAETVSLDLFSMSLNELQLTLHSRTSGWAAGRDLDAHLKRSRVSRLGTPSLKEGYLLSGDGRVFLLGILVLSVMWDVVWDSMSNVHCTYYYGLGSSRLIKLIVLWPHSTVMWLLLIVLWQKQASVATHQWFIIWGTSKNNRRWLYYSSCHA